MFNVLLAGLLAGAVCAHAADQHAAPQPRSLAQWLERLQQASRASSYRGTYVVSSAAGTLSSAHIEHYGDGGMQLERVEMLTGEPRVIFRRNDTVRVYLPVQRVVRSEERAPGNRFPNLLTPSLVTLAEAFYTAEQAGQGRVAGADADIVLIKPLDGLRYGYRIWSERQTGMIVKIQTLDEHGHVLEQSAFSELTLNARVRPGKLLRGMSGATGYRAVHSDQIPTTAQQEGWALNAPVAGFAPQTCYRQRMQGGGEPLVQWVFSDGLATVSLFMERLGEGVAAREGVSAMGATHVLTRRITDGAQAWWLTAVGEVPARTLQEFAARLQPGRPAEKSGIISNDVK
ncbi:MAG: MucB/RseB C-terminal domain-containing protein [Burkholderiaceae bacterium]|nr:MucB/RseB C-terminal domain-containing protein [Burkholderiaceae bacterium]